MQHMYQFLHFKFDTNLHSIFQTEKVEFEVFTYNMSTPYMANDEGSEVSSVVVSYGKNLILICGAQGGRPEPTFLWYIENNQVIKCK